MKSTASCRPRPLRRAERRRSRRSDAALRPWLLDRAFKLAVQNKLISAWSRPYIQEPAEDESRVRQGFLTLDEVERLCSHLSADLADVVAFLFHSAWRVNEARSIEWRDYDCNDRLQGGELRGTHRPDLRRSGVKHLIDAGVDPHTVMAFSGHRTPSMLRRYHHRLGGAPSRSGNGEQLPWTAEQGCDASENRPS